VKQWSLYVLAPHHYVTLCLLRWADGTLVKPIGSSACVAV
jgi:hypothetical protein